MVCHKKLCWFSHKSNTLSWAGEQDKLLTYLVACVQKIFNYKIEYNNG